MVYSLPWKRGRVNSVNMVPGCVHDQSLLIARAKLARLGGTVGRKVGTQNETLQPLLFAFVRARGGVV